MKIAERLCGALQEKSDPHRRWSSFRVVLATVTVVYVVRFLAEPIVTLRWGGVITPLGQPMAWLGITILLAGPLRSWMDKSKPGDITSAIASLFGGGGSAPSFLRRAPAPPRGVTDDRRMATGEVEDDEP